MEVAKRREAPKRKDERVIIHFDYDCFYASVFEAQNPALKSLPLAVQQKHIIVTCNYEARRRGLYKLQLITEAKRICPDVIIVLGEDISQFRDASKELYSFLERFSWSRKVERLGFDEVWLDVTDMVNYTLDILNPNNLQNSFFYLSRNDPSLGFAFDATTYAGHTFPTTEQTEGSPQLRSDHLVTRLQLGSHLAMHMRHQLEEQKGYTSTVGISTNKLISKLVGTLNKPKGQTTLIPPYISEDGVESHVTSFIDSHDIGKIPGIGFKMAQKLREHVLQRAPEFSFGLVYGGTKENVSVRDVRLLPDIDSEKLEKMIAGPGSPHGIGYRIWSLLHGCDDTEVGLARPVPRQISIEDSYIRLDTMAEVLKELTMLARSLIRRMRIDLLATVDEDQDAEEDSGNGNEGALSRRWLAHPKTIRLSTRPKPPLNADGTRTRTFKRISHSAPLPHFIFCILEGLDPLAEKLVHETLVPMFRRLHPEKAGWNLSLVNIAVTNMAETAGESKTANGRDISNMFRRQEDVLKDFRVRDESSPDIKDEIDLSAGQLEDQSLKYYDAATATYHAGSEDVGDLEDSVEHSSPADLEAGLSCRICGLSLPDFAMSAHERYHLLGD